MGKDVGPWGWDFGFRVRICAWGWDLGYETEIWASWLGFWPEDWDLGLNTGIQTSRLIFISGGVRKGRRIFPMCDSDSAHRSSTLLGPLPQNWTNGLTKQWAKNPPYV